MEEGRWGGGGGVDTTFHRKQNVHLTLISNKPKFIILRGTKTDENTKTKM